MTAIVVGTAAGIRSYGSHTVDVLDGADVTTLFAAAGFTLASIVPTLAASCVIEAARL